MKAVTGETLEKLFSLEGKRGVVTGGSSGLGKSISLMLAKAGAHVFVFSRTGYFKDAGARKPVNISHCKVDVTQRQACQRTIDDIGKGGIDFLVNNAGISERMHSSKVTPETWRKIQSVNVDAVYALCQMAYPYLKRASSAGRIVNVASMAAHLGFSEVVPYCASKSAVAGITRGLSVEWAPDNILVNSVSPGWFPSEMHKRLIDYEREKKILERMPLHRYGEPDELASMVLFLVSPAATYITGQDFAVDGGALAFGY